MKKHRKLLTIVSIAFLATLVSCDIIPGSTLTSPSSTTLTGDDLSSFLESLSSSSSSPALTIQGGENRLAIGEKKQLCALLDGVETTEVTWWSQSLDVCTIDENGLVEAIGEGASIIFAEIVVKGTVIQAEITIEVYAGSFEIDEEQVYLYVGEAYDLKFSIDPIECQDSLTWTSGNESVVTVDSTRRLVATEIGETWVAAESNQFYDACNVYVRDPLSEGLEFSIKPDGTYEITSYTSSNENVVIPEYYNGIPVTSIASLAFGYSRLKSLSIPSTIQEIGDHAFYFS